MNDLPTANPQAAASSCMTAKRIFFVDSREVSLVHFLDPCDSSCSIRSVMKQTAQLNRHESAFADSHRSHDRRRHPRFRAGSTIRFPSPDLFGFNDVATEDVSCSGFSFLARNAPDRPAGFYCNLSLPDRGTGGLTLQCRVRIVSSTPRTPGLYRVGCRIEDYFVLPDTASLTS
jgi:hypothetical protein